MSTRVTYKLGIDVLNPTPTAAGADLLMDNFVVIANKLETLENANQLPKTFGNIIIGDTDYPFKLYESASLVSYLDEFGNLSVQAITATNLQVDTITLGGSSLATLLSGKANASHTHSAADITSGNLSDSRLSTTAQTRLTLVGNATSSPTADTLVLRDSIGGTQVTVLNATSVAATDITASSSVSANNVNATTSVGVGGTTYISNGATAIAVTDGDGLNYFTVSNVGAITAPSLSLNGVSMANARQISSLADPNADRIIFWDDSASAYAYLTPTSPVTISGTSISVAAATTSASGIAEIATTAEVTTGTDTIRYITPSSLTSITRLGTIAVGTWQATAIADAYVASASTWNAKVGPTRTINTTAPLSGGGALSADLTLSIAAASGSVAGSMSAAHFNLVNGATDANTASTIVKRSSGGDISVGNINAASLNTTLLNSTSAYWGISGDSVIEFNANLSDHIFQVVDYDYGLAMSIGSGVIDFFHSVNVGNSFTANTVSSAVYQLNGTNSSSSGTYKPIQIATTYTQSGTAGSTDFQINRSQTSLGSGSHYFIDCQIGGSTRFAVSNGGIVEGGTNWATSSLRMKLDLADNATFPSCSFKAPNGYYLRVANVSVYGTNDMFFQGVTTGSSAWTYLEGWTGAGLALGTGGNGDKPIDIRPNRTTMARFLGAGLYIGGATDPTAPLDIGGNRIRIRTAKTPSSATDTGNAGEVCWDSSYVYVCTATNTWKRSAIATW